MASVWPAMPCLIAGSVSYSLGWVRDGCYRKTTLIEKYGNDVVLSCLFGLIAGERGGCWATKVAALSIRPLVAPGIVMNLD